MDGSRRHFDDIDGCGGPPVGELIVPDGGGGASGGLARLRPRRGLQVVGDGASRAARGRRSPKAGDGRIPPEAVGAGLDRNRRLTTALAVTFAAAGVAFAVVTLMDGSTDAFKAVVPSALRRLAVPPVVAALAFHVVAAAGLVLAKGERRGGVLRPPTRVAGEDLLRGGIAFLLALFAASFVTSAMRTSGAQWSDIPVRLDPLAAVEVVLLVVVAPLVQERLFRGLLLVALRDRLGPVAGVLGQAAIAGAALAWMAAPGGRGLAAGGAFAVAGVFGWFAHATDDLRPGMLGSAFFALWLLAGRVAF